METFANVLSIAIPGFLVLIIIESLVAKYKGLEVNRPFDTISSISSGMTFTLKQLLGLTVIILSYDWMVGHLALVSLPNTWWVIILAFIGLDFAGYWQHRFNHEINILWNRHIIHHSSEEFNLACALRQNVSVFLQIYFFLYVPMALIGIPTEVIAFISPIHFFAQFWYHTRLIDKMGFLEYIIVTPSHHRVHHAINDEYIDKNYSEIFIVWDKLFGTFQEELKDVPAVYGTKKPANTWNPLIINFMHVWQIIKDAWHTRNWIDKIRIWFMPTGWRPEDVKKKYPIKIVEDVYNRPKYASSYSNIFLAWSWFQFGLSSILFYLLLISIADISFSTLITAATFLFFTIFSYTSLMDRHWSALLAELTKFICGAFLIASIPEFGPPVNYQLAIQIALLVYMMISFVLTFYWIKQPFKAKQTSVLD